MPRLSQRIGSKEQKTPHNIAEPLAPSCRGLTGIHSHGPHSTGTVLQVVWASWSSVGFAGNKLQELQRGMHDNIPRGGRDAAGSHTRVK
jgi:hypothetical protein